MPSIAALKKLKISWAFVLILVAIIFSSVLRAGYFADDFGLLQQRQTQKLGDTISLNGDGNLGGGSWRPLTTLSFWLTLGHDQSGIFNHAVSLTLYLIVVYLFGQVIKIYFSDWRPEFFWLAVIAFALMPIHAEPVYWIAARADLLAAIFGLATIIFWKKDRHVGALVCFILSLLAKEFWILLPIGLIFFDNDFTIKKRGAWGAGFLATLLIWFFIRQHITGFVLGGYSVPVVRAISWRHLLNEAMFFVSSSWLAGEWQNKIGLLAYHYAKIFGTISLVVCIVLIWWRRHSKKFLIILGYLILLLAPMLFLHVPFWDGVPSLAEQRYWFAPSIFLIIFGVQLFSYLSEKIKTFWGRRLIWTAASAVLMFWFMGLINNLHQVEVAANYRDSILASWSKWTKTNDPGTARIELLPDSWGGVHLFAAPFFVDALQYYDLPRPAAVGNWYLLCDFYCSQNEIQLSEPNSYKITSARIRIFSPQAPLRRVNLLIEPKSGEVVVFWDGRQFQNFGLKPVEKQPPGRY